MAPEKTKRFRLPPMASRGSKSLIVQAGLLRTFGSVAGFVALLCFTLGIYLLEEVLANPLTAQPMGLFVGAFTIAVATLIVYFLVGPWAKSR